MHIVSAFVANGGGLALEGGDVVTLRRHPVFPAHSAGNTVADSSVLVVFGW